MRLLRRPRRRGRHVRGGAGPRAGRRAARAGGARPGLVSASRKKRRSARQVHLDPCVLRGETSSLSFLRSTEGTNMRRAYLAAVVVSLLCTLGGSAQAAKLSATINLSTGATMTVSASGTTSLMGKGRVAKGNVHFDMSVSGGAFQ